MARVSTGSSSYEDIFEAFGSYREASIRSRCGASSKRLVTHFYEVIGER